MVNIPGRRSSGINCLKILCEYGMLQDVWPFYTQAFHISSAVLQVWYIMLYLDVLCCSL